MAIGSERATMPADRLISYRRKDRERVLPLVHALRDESISSWLDQSEIDEFAPITDAIRKRLSESKALLAWRLATLAGRWERFCPSLPQAIMD